MQREALQHSEPTSAVVHRLSHGAAFTWGEEERLAATLRSLVLRTDARLAMLSAWLVALPPAWNVLWSTPVLNRDVYAQLGNAKQTLRALSPVEHTPTVDATRAELLAALLALE